MVTGDELSGVLGPLEAAVMRVMWSRREPMSVRAVLDELNEDRSPRLAYTTVMTVMARLAEKEILARRRDGRGYVYEPIVADAAAIAVRNVVRDFGDAAISGFLDQAQADPELLRRLERVLRDHGAP